jgi:hypothetical protein
MKSAPAISGTKKMLSSRRYTQNLVAFGSKRTPNGGQYRAWARNMCLHASAKLISKKTSNTAQRIPSEFHCRSKARHRNVGGLAWHGIRIFR